MSAKDKKNIAAEALVTADNIKAAIKEESKSTIQNLLQEAVKDYMRDAIDGDEDDFEIQDDNEKDAAEDNLNNDAESSTDDAKDGEFPEGEDFKEVPDDEPAAKDGEEAKDDAEDSSEDETPEEGGEDEWSEFDKFKVDDDTYDLTGEKDYDSVVKVYKLLKDEDNIVVKKDGDKLTLKDGANDAEYVIDLGADDESDSEPAEELKENNIAGIPENLKENKKNRKTMKENKERIFEVDLGYTDNYQKKDPIEGLSNNEPGKGKDWDEGLPKGTEKPWVGDKVKSAGEPYEKAVNETEEPALTDITEPEKPEEAPVEEATNVGGAVQERGAGISHIPAGREEYVPDGSRHLSAGGDYKEVKLAESILAKSEAILKENKELKATLNKVTALLQEARVVNVSLGKVTKLFLENTTTKNEKVDIINRFNEAKTIEESNALYESIKRELNNTKQSVMLEGASATAKGSEINENKIYESKDLLDIRSFMKRMDNC